MGGHDLLPVTARDFAWRVALSAPVRRAAFALVVRRVALAVRPAALALAFALPALLPLEACYQGPKASSAAPSLSAPTHVARGELFSTGLVVYDQYFESVHDLQVEAANLPDDRRASRSSITQALNLLPTASSEQILAQLRTRVAELKAQGIRLIAQGPGFVAVGKAPLTEAKQLAQTLSLTVSSERGLDERVAELPGRATSLSLLSANLEPSLDKDFKDPARRREVSAELDAAKSALSGLAEEATTSGKKRFVDDLYLEVTGARPPASAAGKKKGT